MNTFEKSRRFVYRNARPLTLALWQYHLEGGSRDAVMTALAAYQNEDGGFGHGLEEDSFNPDSTPIATWNATEVLREIGMTDRTHPMMQEILRYLASGAGFDAQRSIWLGTVPSNNDHPHAIWWSYNEQEKQSRYNPTACLAGFYLKYGEKSSAFYAAAEAIARETYKAWHAERPADEHDTACLIRLYEYCCEAGIAICDMDAFSRELQEEVRQELWQAADRWETDYVAMPSFFIKSGDSLFYPGNEALVEKDCAFIRRTQLPDGSFHIPWRWHLDYPEWEIAKNWWKSDFCIRNMLLLKTFGQ